MKRKLSLIMAVVMTLTMVFGYVGRINTNAKTIDPDDIYWEFPVRNESDGITFYSLSKPLQYEAEIRSLDPMIGSYSELYKEVTSKNCILLIKVKAYNEQAGNRTLYFPIIYYSGEELKGVETSISTQVFYGDKFDISYKIIDTEYHPVTTGDNYASTSADTPFEATEVVGTGIRFDSTFYIKNNVPGSYPYQLNTFGGDGSYITSTKSKNMHISTFSGTEKKRDSELMAGGSIQLAQGESRIFLDNVNLGFNSDIKEAQPNFPDEEPTPTEDVEALKKQIEELKKQIEELKNEKKSIEVKVTDAETAKTEAETNLQDKTKELEEANKKIAELEEKLKNTQAGDPADKETIKKLQEELNAEKAKVQDLENKVKELEAQIATLENDKKDLENKLATADGKVKELEKQVSDKDAKIAELEAQIAEKDKAIAEKDEQIKSLEAEKQAKEAKINDLTAELEKAKADLEQAGADKDKLNARIAELEAEIARLKAENESLNAEIDKLKAEIEALKGQVADRDKTIADKDNTIADLNKKAEDLQKEIDELKNHVDDLDQLIAKLKAEKDGLTDEINKANADLDNAKKDLEALKKELEDAKAKAETEKKALQDELNAEKAKLAELNKEIAKNEEDKKALQDKLNAEKAKADADQNKIKELEGKIADKDNEKKALDNAKSELENKVAEKTAELEAKDKEIADLNTKIAEKEDAIKALEEKIAKLEAEKKDLEDKIKALLDKDTKKDDYIKELQDELEKIKKALEEAKAKEGIPSDKVAEDMKALQDQIAKLQKELEDAKKALENKDKKEDKKPETEKEFKVSELKDGDSKVEVTLPENIEAGDKVTVTKNGKKVGEKTLTNTDIKAGKTVVELTERVKPGDTIVTIITGKDGKEKASSFDGVRELTDAEVKERLKKLIDEARGIRNPSEELNKALDKAIDVIYDRFATINEYKWAIEDLERELDRIRHARNNRFKIELNAEPKVGDTKFEGTTQTKWYVDAFVNGKRVAYTQADARGNFTITLKEALKAGDKFRLFSVDPRNDDDYTEAEWKLAEDKKSDDKNSKVVITDEMLKGQGLDPKELVIFPVGQLFYNIVKDGEKTTVNMDSRPYNNDGRIMMPMRYVAYAMGFNVEWDNNTREAVFTNNSNPVLPKRTIRVQIDTGKVYDTEGNVYNFDRKPVNINGRIHVSISNVAKAFGATTGYITDDVDQTIEWDQAKQAVYVFKYVK